MPTPTITNATATQLADDLVRALRRINYLYFSLTDSLLERSSAWDADDLESGRMLSEHVNVIDDAVRDLFVELLGDTYETSTFVDGMREAIGGLTAAHRLCAVLDERDPERIQRARAACIAAGIDPDMAEVVR